MNKNLLLQYLHFHPESSRAEIEAALAIQVSSATLKRMLVALTSDGYIAVTGQGRATRYSITPQAHLLMTIDLETYFQKDIDEREVQYQSYAFRDAVD